MIKFLLKGVLRDKSRSLLPIAVVTIGVMLTVFLSGYMKGVMGDAIDLTARFQTGHLKVLTQPYFDNQQQMPNDLALLGVDEIMANLEKDYPDYSWSPRIKFGGLVDIPGKDGDTRSQGPCFGQAIDLLGGTEDSRRLNIENSLVRGTIPSNPREALLSEDFAQKLDVEIGEDITFFGSTMNGSMTFQNFVLVGTVKFGNPMLDRGSLLIDIGDAQGMLDMYDGAGEIFGFSKQGAYNNAEAVALASQFNQGYADSDDEFKPKMIALIQQNDMEQLLTYAENMGLIFVFIFVFAMSLVLWNSGILGGLRRYQEFGIRLALGESKGHIYRSLISEAVLIGGIGSITGSIIGLTFCFLLQKYGIDISEMMPESTMMYPNVIRAKITPELYFIGFIPGVFSMVLGNMLAGVGIYKRQTAQLFKELEV